ncbi:MAG: response regulator transcription factor [Synergistaceae bacterium]|jgi:DNA-binding NarL/FixJ family response regulator|nr:response regulator transcription factor [Synergistaceae bacterium]
MRERKKKLKVFIMDDSDIFRAGLTEILRREDDDFELADGGGGPDEAEAFCLASAPNVLIVHASKRNMDRQLQAAGRIKRGAEGIRVLIVAEFADVEYLLKIAASGCDGYVHSGISGRSLVNVIRNLGNDVCIFDRAVIDKLLLLEDERRAARQVEFSPRERRIVEMMAEGKNNSAIAKELNLSGGTVKNTVSDMLKRHRFKNRAQLVNMLSL